MAFTTGERQELAAARMRVLELEAKEELALSQLAAVLNLVPSFARSANWTAAEVAEHADVIRDALAPFDSGVRLKDEA